MAHWLKSLAIPSKCNGACCAAAADQRAANPVSSATNRFRATALLPSFLLLGVLLGGGLFPNPLLADGTAPLCTGHSLSLSTEDVVPPKLFDVPLVLHKAGPLPSPVLRIGLDYDELVLTNQASIRIDETFEGSASVENVSLDLGLKRVTFDVLLDSTWAASDEITDQPLARLTFGFTNAVLGNLWEQFGGSNPRANIHFLMEKTAFKSQTAGAPALSVCSKNASFDILLRDEIKLASAGLSNNEQTVTLPIQVTHVVRESISLEFRVDIDETFLEIEGVTLSDDYKSRFDEKRTTLDFDPQDNTVGLVFPGGDYPILRRSHVLDLHVTYLPENGVVGIGDVLKVQLLSLDEGGDGGSGGKNPGLDYVHGRLEILPPYFLRGDVDLDGVLALNDAISLLKATFFGRDLACRETADVNDDVRIDISDALYLLVHLLIAGPPPSAPYPEKGPDPNPHVGFGCENYGRPFYELMSLDS